MKCCNATGCFIEERDHLLADWFHRFGCARNHTDMCAYFYKSQWATKEHEKWDARARELIPELREILEAGL